MVENVSTYSISPCNQLIFQIKIFKMKELFSKNFDFLKSDVITLNEQYVSIVSPS